jgi:hypothetical protein
MFFQTRMFRFAMWILKQSVTKGLGRLFSIFSPCRRTRFAHLLRYQRLAVLQYSFTSECLANERIEFVKYPGVKDKTN